MKKLILFLVLFFPSFVYCQGSKPIDTLYYGKKIFPVYIDTSGMEYVVTYTVLTGKPYKANVGKRLNCVIGSEDDNRPARAKDGKNVVLFKPPFLPLIVFYVSFDDPDPICK